MPSKKSKIYKQVTNSMLGKKKMTKTWYLDQWHHLLDHRTTPLNGIDHAKALKMFAPIYFDGFGKALNPLDSARFEKLMAGDAEKKKSASDQGVGVDMATITKLGTTKK